MAQKEQASSALKQKKAEALFYFLKKKNPRTMSKEFYDTVRDSFTFSKSETDRLVQHLIDDEKVAVDIAGGGRLQISLN